MKEMELYLDPKLVKEATLIFESLGLDLETGIRIFLTKIAHEFEWPYEVEVADKVSEELVYHGKPTILSLDEYSYEESTNFFKYEAKDSSNAVNDYLKKVILYKGIPFNMKVREYSAELLESLKEAEEMERHPERYKAYHNVDELFADLNKDIDENI